MRDPAPQTAFEEVKGVRTIACRHQGDYVQFMLREWPGGGQISISGSYDAMSTHAFSFGKMTFTEFLAGCDQCYMMKKLLNGQTTVPDWEESVKELKRALLRRRREDGREADAARAERLERGVFGSVFGHRYTHDRPGLTKEATREHWDDFFGNQWEGDEEIFRRAVTDAPEYVFGSDAYELGRNKLKGWIPYFWTQFWEPFIEYLEANPLPGEEATL